jgi:hypothetical protein
MTAKITALATIDPPPVPAPLFGGKEMAQAFSAYQQLQATLDQAMPDQIIKLGGRPFRRKGYWRAVATAFNLTLELVEERREVHGTFEDGHDNFVFFVVYKATTPTGRSGIGDGSCAALEKASRTDRNKWAVLPFQATEHNVRSHAHTRACNRAVSNLVGFGEVSAEELERDDDEHQAAPSQLPPLPPADRPRATDPPQRPPVPPPPQPQHVRRVAPDSKPITEPQRRRLFATSDEAKKANNPWPSRDAVKQALYAAFGIESTTDLRMADYEQALEIVARGPRLVPAESEAVVAPPELP